MTVVSNASPLITLSKIGALKTLPELFGKVIVPAEVFHEVTVIGAGRPGSIDVQNASWIDVRTHSNPELFGLYRARGLGAGETATIVLAQELSAQLAIIDERAARVLAASLGMNIIGCVGVLESAARKNIILDLRSAYQKLLASGTYIDRAILNRSLRSFDISPLE